MTSVAVPLWLDLLTVGIGALQGALFAIFYKRFDLVGVIAVAILAGLGDRKSTRLNSSHVSESRMPSSA